MNPKACWLAIPVGLVAMLVSFAASAQLTTGSDWNLKRIQDLQAKAAQQPLKVSCYQGIATRVLWGHHGVNFGLNLATKSVVLVGWSKLTDVSGPSVGPQQILLHSQHDHKAMANLAVKQTGPLLQASYHYETSYERPCGRCAPDPGPTIHILNSLEFAATMVPGSKELKLQKLVVDNKEFPAFMTKCSLD